MAASPASPRRYPSDLTDDQWALIEPLLPPHPGVGRTEKHLRRELVNAILYVRCQGNRCSDFTPIATVGHDVSTYTDEGLARNTKYSYRVHAFNTGGVSEYSNIATGKTRQR